MDFVGVLAWGVLGEVWEAGVVEDGLDFGACFGCIGFVVGVDVFPCLLPG